MEENTSKNNIFIYLLVVFFALFFGTGIFLILNNSKEKSGSANQAASTTIKEGKMVIPTEAPTEGSLEILSALGAARFSNNKEFSVNLQASSNNRNIVGYDMILYYDPEAFNFVKAVSLISDFQVYTYRRTNYVVITAIRGLQSVASSLEKTPMAKLTFLPKKIGKYDLSLRSTLGADKTKLVTDKTKILNPKLTDLPIEIIE